MGYAVLSATSVEGMCQKLPCFLKYLYLIGRSPPVPQGHELWDALWVYLIGRSPPVPQGHELWDALWVYKKGLTDLELQKAIPSMLTGDVEGEGEEQLTKQLEEQYRDYTWEILKVAHHGSKNSSSEELMKVGSYCSHRTLHLL